MHTRISSIESKIESSALVEFPNNFALETAELEMILAMKFEEGLSFSTALPSALTSSGNEWLFDFPADRFPIDAKNVAAIRICSGADDMVAYVYEQSGGAGFGIATENHIDHAYFEFARSYAEVAGALEPVLASARNSDLH